MYKNQLQEIAQRSCFNLPSYTCIRQGVDHAPRFKASVNFNGEIFESPNYCPTLRQAEHAAAEVALNVLSTRGPSRTLTARVLDETGIYKNLLQETAHRAGLRLPVYTTVRSGPGHVPTFACTVELAGMTFTGESAKTKKQAEKNAAIAAWSALNQMPKLGSLTTKQDSHEEQANVTRVLSSFRPKDDGKQVRKRDPNPPKKIFKGHHRDNNIGSSSSSSSSSSSNIYSQDERLKLMEMIKELSQEDSILKYNTFASLLPPPPPRTVSKILPPTTRPIPVQVRSRSSPYLIQTPLEDHHKKDEEQWLGTKPSVIKPCHHPLSSNLNPYTTTTTSSASASSGIKSSHLSRTMFSGQSRPHRIAPAVQIRSVIPVCAAAPVTNSATTTTKPGAEEVSSSSVATTASAKFNKPQFSLLGSEFNKLQL
ncbi:double-stranded RNA-binding protein 3-like [Humulus lupulus]|uniref:double-stranded RNA-binding protein 3-like n=1 Tax=Humulus lupulus TaxID=3486 RepID=UPI002B415700|nr:double-stranded RNA-binding protein 3-like [Humulus lupulus]XP_062105389.1 double-stranded RNA-binding protein 3-like [Humulus lupulus]XP_062105390.1 double-stranded RNA-binding protein 3-like [Humulus lupulus]XP_062105391.1 double-stranded RNA-binding protein 3-like [Humulus lupulus]